MLEALVIVLGCAGILPFVLLLLWADNASAGFFFKAYSLAILAFIAGNWWSAALIAQGPGNRQRIVVLLMSNVLVLAGVALLISTSSAAYLGLGGVFGIQVLGEHRLRVFRDQPAYYRYMRNGVAAMVVLLHLLAWRRFAV